MLITSTDEDDRLFLQPQIADIDVGKGRILLPDGLYALRRWRKAVPR